MFSNRSFLVLGGGAADIVSLIKGGLEILDCNFLFQQGVDGRGKAMTRVLGGIINITLAQLPPQEIIDWALNSREYKGGLIVMLDNENMPIEKVFFENAACVYMDIDYTQRGDNYACTKLVINAEKMIVGNNIDFENDWTN